MNRGLMHILDESSITGLNMAKPIPAERILVVAPHCDDEILGCGGTILKYLQSGCEVTIFFATIDEEQRRKGEAISIWSQYDNITVIFADVIDSTLNKNDISNMFYDLISLTLPNIIFVPWFLDKHIDHRACVQYLGRALRQIHNTQDIIIGSYEVNFPLYINYAVNINKTIDEKCILLGKYETQNVAQLEKVIRALNQYRARQIGLNKIHSAEGFYFCKVNNYLLLIENLGGFV